MSKEKLRLYQCEKMATFQMLSLNALGFIPRGLPRICHTGESRYPENPTGFRVKHGMTA
jgi:hypothetical protein